MSHKGRIELTGISFASKMPGVITSITFDVFEITSRGHIDRMGFLLFESVEGTYKLTSSPGGFTSLKKDLPKISITDIATGTTQNSFGPILDLVEKEGYAVQSFVESSVRPILSTECLQQLVGE